MQTRVCFVEDGTRRLTVLELRAPRRHPLTQNLDVRFRKLGITIVHAESRMINDDVEMRLHVAEFNGSPLSPRRRLELQTLLLSSACPSEIPPPTVAKASADRSAEALHGKLDANRKA